jgi:hypothetical protein
MVPTKRQMWGWKEIASHLDVSERTAKRWEATRQLPVHRAPGQARDAVFARIDELDAWLAVTTSGPKTNGGEVRDVSGNLATVPRWLSRRTLVRAVAALSFLLPLLSLAAWHATTPTATTSNGSRSLQVAALRVSTAARWTAEVRIPVGECGRLQLPASPTLELCPEMRASLLLVTIRRPAAPGGAANTKTISILLEENQMTRVLDPFTFDLEWIAPGKRAPLP